MSITRKCHDLGSPNFDSCHVWEKFHKLPVGSDDHNSFFATFVKYPGVSFELVIDSVVSSDVDTSLTQAVYDLIASKVSIGEKLYLETMRLCRNI